MMASTQELQAEVEEVSAGVGRIRIVGALAGPVPEEDRPWRLRLSSRERGRRPLVRRILGEATRSASRDYVVTVAGRRFAAEIQITDFAPRRSLPYQHWDAYLLVGRDVTVPLERRAGRSTAMPTQTTAEKEPLVICPHFTDRGALSIRARRAVMTRDE